jgi:hypothetical protein
MRRLPGPSARSHDHDGRLDEPGPPSNSQIRSVSPRLRTLAAVGAAGAVYFVLACLIYWPATPLDANRLAGCACGDPQQQTWFLAWTSFALTHGHNPFLTSYLHAPMGANLAIDTSMPLLGALGIPITLTAGPVAAFNLLLRLGLAASGASLFGVLRRYTSWWPAAFGGGLLFMLSPYVANQGIRHLFLSFVPLVPLFIPILDDWLISRRRSAVRSGLLLGLVAALQYLISAEILLTSAIMAVVALAYLALRYRSGVRERMGALLQGVAAAVPAFLLIAGYGIWMLLAGPDRPKGAVHTLSGLVRYHGDLLSPLYPTSHQLIAPAALAAVGNRLATGLTIENGFYLGFPLVVLLGYLVIRCRRIPLVGVAVTVGVAAFILGLGSRLTVNGKTLSVPLPFAILQHLPVVQNLEAARFSLFIQLAAAIIFAVGLDRVRARGWLPASARAARHAVSQGQPPGAQGTPEPQGIAAAQGAAAPPGAAPEPGAAPPQRDVPAPDRPGWVRPVVVGAVGLVALLPILPNLPLPTADNDTPGFFSSQNVHVVPAGALALTLPFDLAPQNDAMMWQAASGMRFRILGGDAFVRKPNGLTTWHWQPAGPQVLLQVLRAGRYPKTPPPPMTPAAIAAVRRLIATQHVSVVLVDRAVRDGGALAMVINRALRAPPLQRGRMDIWLNVQRDLHRHPA